MKFFVGPNVSMNDFISILDEGGGGGGGGGACGFNLKFWHFDSVDDDDDDGCTWAIGVSLFLSIIVASFSSFFTFAPRQTLLIVLGTMAFSLTVVAGVALMVLEFEATKFQINKCNLFDFKFAKRKRQP